MKPHNQPLELLPLPPKSLYGRPFFHYMHLSVSLALWLQRRSATAMVTGSNPAQRSKGRFCDIGIFLRRGDSTQRRIFPLLN